MARRMTLEGAKVKAVFEILPYSNGLNRNIVQCLEDFGIPLYLSHSVVAVHGADRVTGVTVAKVDASMNPIPGTEFDVNCDCVLLSVGLIPENELGRASGLQVDSVTGGAVVDQFRRTSLPGYFTQSTCCMSTTSSIGCRKRPRSPENRRRCMRSEGCPQLAVTELSGRATVSERSCRSDCRRPLASALFASICARRVRWAHPYCGFMRTTALYGSASIASSNRAR